MFLDQSHDQEAESALLGSILVENNLIWDLMTKIKPEDFYVESNRIIFAAMIDIVENGSGEIDPVSLRHALNSRGELKAVGGATGLSGLIDSMQAPGNAETYASIVKEHALRRKLSVLALQLNDNSKDPVERINSVMAQMGEAITRSHEAKVRTVPEAAVEYLKRRDSGESAACVTTGLTVLDGTMTIRRGNVVVVAGHPGTGKSSLAAQVAMNAAKDGHVLFVSLEMSEEELIERYVQYRSGCSAHIIANPKLTTEDSRKRIDDAFSRVVKEGGTLHLVSPGITTPQDILAMARAIQIRNHDLQLVVVDYLQLMHCPERNMSSTERVTWLSRNMKTIARQLDTPIMLLSQLRRSPSQEAREPELHDLRDSGAIEQDADIVLFTHRPDANTTGVLLLLRKQRHGPTGMVRAEFDMTRCRFIEKEMGY